MSREALEAVTDGVVTRLMVDGKALRARDLFAGLRDSPSVRASFRALLAAARFEAFFWETPALDASRLDAPYEHVVLDARRLAETRADPSAFAEHFSGGEDVVVFPSLRGDATLVVPCPPEDRARRRAYAHLASFVREAEPGRVDALLEALGEAVLARVGDEPVWVSTSGLGVPWLHVRIDTVPKYYQHRPYAARS